MKQFFKDNLVLVAGIALPLVLALVFFAATKLTAVAVDPPKTKLVFVANYPDYYNNGHPWQFIVREGKLMAQYTPPQPNTPYPGGIPELYVHDPIEGKSKKVTLPAVADKKTEEIPIEDLKNTKLDTGTRSPDGYVFEAYYRGGGNLMTEIFGGGYGYRSNYVLRKGTYIKDIEGAPAYNSKFIGWVIE